MSPCSALLGNTAIASKHQTTDHGMSGVSGNHPTVMLFEKRLTRSDANGQGRVVLPKAAAEKHLPPLTHASGRKLVCYDTSGGRHDLQFRFWVNTQSRMYLVEGVHGLQAVYNLKAGDVLVFARAHDRRLVVYPRSSTAADKPCRGVKRRAEAPTEGAGPRAVEMLTPHAPEAPRSMDGGFREEEQSRRCKRVRRPTAKAAAWAAVGGMRRWAGWSSEEDDAQTPIQAAWGGAYLPLSVDEQRKLLPTPVVDGVFRPLDADIPSPPPPFDCPYDHRLGPSHILLRAAHTQGVWLYDAGVWLATLVLPGGGVLQAAFETRAAAENALATAT